MCAIRCKKKEGIESAGGSVDRMQRKQRRKERRGRGGDVRYYAALEAARRRNDVLGQEPRLKKERLARN